MRKPDPSTSEKTDTEKSNGDYQAMEVETDHETPNSKKPFYKKKWFKWAIFGGTAGGVLAATAYGATDREMNSLCHAVSADQVYPENHMLTGSKGVPIYPEGTVVYSGCQYAGDEDPFSMNCHDTPFGRAAGNMTVTVPSGYVASIWQDGANGDECRAESACQEGQWQQVCPGEPVQCSVSVGLADPQDVTVTFVAEDNTPCPTTSTNRPTTASALGFFANTTKGDAQSAETTAYLRGVSA